MNPRMISSIKTAPRPLTMVTNAGTKKLSQKGVINGFGEAWYDPSQVANIFGFAKLEDQYRITYDSSTENAFNVHTNDAIVKFKRNEDGLYVYRPSERHLKSVNKDKQKDKQNDDHTNIMVQTLEENRKDVHKGNLMTPNVRGNYTTLLDAQPWKILKRSSGRIL
jgi:hypothetical protein